MRTRSSAAQRGVRVTTRHAQAAYPFLANAGLGGEGALIGRDRISGGGFYFDPWLLYERKELSDANMLVFGKLGFGKSALIKTLIWRMLLFGRRAFVIDVKREYGALCALAGVTPIQMQPGGNVRLNPLTAGADPLAQLELLRAIALTACGTPLTQDEAGALREALRVIVQHGGSSEPTIPDIAALLFEPTAEMAQGLHTTPAPLREQVRRVALALQDLCDGPLRGMFDGPTSPGLDLDARLVVLDLHAVRDSGAVGILMACATAWMSAMLARLADRPDTGKLMSVADEAWKMIGHHGLGEWFQENFKLSRKYGVMNVVVLHKVGDLLAAGDGGSREAEIAKGLIADASTRVMYKHDNTQDQLDAAHRLLGLSGPETELLPRLPKGQAVWQVGGRSFLVVHKRSEIEKRMSDTDEGMRARRDQRHDEPHEVER